MSWSSYRKNDELDKSDDERDDKTLNADIYVFTTLADGFQADSRSFQHWILVAKFPHKTMYLDANNNVFGQLAPYVNYSEPEGIKSRKFMGSVKTSVQRMKELAFNHPLNFHIYSALANNCQNWVNFILIDLGFLSPLNPIGTVTQKALFGGAMVAGFFGAPGLMMYGAAMFIVNAVASGSSSRR